MLESSQEDYKHHEAHDSGSLDTRNIGVFDSALRWPTQMGWQRLRVGDSPHESKIVPAD